ncbi:hypothetical protein BH24DEI1_BH24DEI1_00140 [soil metagenome]|jgi:hypothetical protein
MNELNESSRPILKLCLASAAPDLLELLEDEVRTGGSRDHGAKLDSLLVEWRRFINPQAYSQLFCFPFAPLLCCFGFRFRRRGFQQR